MAGVPKLGTSDISVYCTYKLKWKPLFDGRARLDLIVSLYGCITWEDPPVSDVPKLGTSDIRVSCTYKLKWKPLFDSRVLGVLHI